jgi:hypothetical protein
LSGNGFGSTQYPFPYGNHLANFPHERTNHDRYQEKYDSDFSFSHVSLLRWFPSTFAGGCFGLGVVVAVTV